MQSYLFFARLPKKASETYQKTLHNFVVLGCCRWGSAACFCPFSFTFFALFGALSSVAVFAARPFSPPPMRRSGAFKASSIHKKRERSSTEDRSPCALIPGRCGTVGVYYFESCLIASSMIRSRPLANSSSVAVIAISGSIPLSMCSLLTLKSILPGKTSSQPFGR